MPRMSSDKNPDGVSAGPYDDAQPQQNIDGGKMRLRGLGTPFGSGNGPSVQIEKAENGYMVTLESGGAGGELMGGVGPYSKPDELQLAELQKEMDRTRPRVFVYVGIEDAWEAIKEFLLDGRMPKGD